MDISIEINIFKENNQLIKIQLNNILILIFFFKALTDNHKILCLRFLYIFVKLLA